MADYISRDFVLELSREYYTPSLREEAVPAKAIKNIPSEDVAEVRHGKWSDEQVAYSNEYGDLHFGYKCSACGAILNKTNYCGACGAKMRETDE